MSLFRSPQCLRAEAACKNEALQPCDAPLQHPRLPTPPCLTHSRPHAQTGQDVCSDPALTAAPRLRLLHGPQVRQAACGLLHLHHISMPGFCSRRLYHGESNKGVEFPSCRRKKWEEPKTAVLPIICDA